MSLTTTELAPEPASDESAGGSAQRYDDWAICCSGGGIRSATYCLGGLQSLDEGGLLGKAKWIVGVSGGSYIAAPRPAVDRHPPQHGRFRPPYARAPPEEYTLANNPHDSAPD